MTRIGILATLWRRHDLERVMLRRVSEMEIPGVKLVCLAVGSEGEASADVAKSAGWNYITARNKPLSDKHNKGMRWFRDKGVTAVICINSDGAISESTLRRMLEEVKSGTDVVALEDLYYYDVRTDAAHYGVRHHPGSGCLYSARALERVGWEPWPKGLNRGLDGRAMNRMHKSAYPCKYKYLKNCRKHGLYLVDVKSDVNMWTMKELVDMTGRMEPVDLTEFDAAFPGLREQLKQLNQPMRETSGY